MAQDRVEFLVQKANGMFLEGAGARRAFAKDGAAAALTNGLLEDAKTAAEIFFKSRGYDPNKPEAVQARLGYALDRAETTAYLVTGALHKPLLSPPEARLIATRITNIIGGSGTIGKKLKKLRKRGKSTASQVAALLQATAALNLEPPPRASTAPSPAQPAEPPAAQLPQPLPPTRSGRKVKGSAEAARALYTAHRCMAWHASEENLAAEYDSDDSQHDPDEPEIKAFVWDRYLDALLRLRVAFPEVVCCAAFERGGCHCTRPCPCGDEVCGAWPWSLRREDHCDCPGCFEGLGEWEAGFGWVSAEVNEDTRKFFARKGR